MSVTWGTTCGHQRSTGSQAQGTAATACNAILEHSLRLHVFVRAGRCGLCVAKLTPWRLPEVVEHKALLHGGVNSVRKGA